MTQKTSPRTSPKTSEVRPLTSRALKSAVDSLRPWIAGSRVLDLYAGMGRFGLQAMQEMAATVTFVEKDFKHAEAIRKLASKYKGNFEVVSQDAESFLRQRAAQSQKFDIVFADPPFPIWNANFSEQLTALVFAIMETGAIFLVKHPKRMLLSDSPIKWLKTWKTARFGESELTYFEYAVE